MSYELCKQIILNIVLNMKEIEEKKYEGLNYKVSREPVYEGKSYANDPEMKKLMSDTYHDVKKNKPNIIENLKELVRKYPNEPILKNYLSTAYTRKGKTEKADEVNDRLLKEHPDYLFGKLYLAEQYYVKGKFEKMAELMGPSMDIQQLYPERKEFHITEVMGFNKAAVKYFLGTKNIEQARERLEIMRKLEPESKDTIKAGS